MTVNAHSSAGAKASNRKLLRKPVLEVPGRFVMMLSFANASVRDSPFFTRGYYTPEWWADDLETG
jgi:hypothetical protein